MAAKGEEIVGEVRVVKAMSREGMSRTTKTTVALDGRLESRYPARASNCSSNFAKV